MQTNDRNLTDLMASVHSAKAQLPDFQRGWVWDDDRIKALIASITSNYPVGAAMFLAYGNEDIRFKHRTIENVQATNVVPDELILDGQQRLTSIYSSLYSKLRRNQFFRRRESFQAETCLIALSSYQWLHCARCFWTTIR